MRSFVQLTLELFGAQSRMDKGFVAPESVVNPEPPGVPQSQTRSIDTLATPAHFRHPQANREVRLGHAQVAYLLQRARRRSIGFVVGADGLVVRAPPWTPLYAVDAALQQKAGWITRKLDEARQRQALRLPMDWRDGAELPFLGQTLRLRLDPTHGFKAKGAQLRDDGQLLLALPSQATAAQIRASVQAWMMRQAQEHFTRRLNHFAPLLGVQWTQLRLSNAATRWGSAKSDGSIRLNWRLLHFRPAIVDYVVAHELSHLRVMNHSPRFWDTVRSVLPEYAQLRSQLKDDALPRY